MHFGDIANNDGTGHTSFYEDNRYIKDEIDNNLTFCEPGLVALANKGPNTNGSQFFVNLDDFDYEFSKNKFVIIGKIIDGFESLKSISAICGDIEKIKENCDVRIVNTGIYNYEEYLNNNKKGRKINKLNF